MPPRVRDRHGHCKVGVRVLLGEKVNERGLTPAFLLAGVLEARPAVEYQERIHVPIHDEPSRLVRGDLDLVLTTFARRHQDEHAIDAGYEVTGVDLCGALYDLVDVDDRVGVTHGHGNPAAPGLVEPVAYPQEMLFAFFAKVLWRDDLRRITADDLGHRVVT